MGYGTRCSWSLGLCVRVKLPCRNPHINRPASDVKTWVQIRIVSQISDFAKSYNIVLVHWIHIKDTFVINQIFMIGSPVNWRFAVELLIAQRHLFLPFVLALNSFFEGTFFKIDSEYPNFFLSHVDESYRTCKRVVHDSRRRALQKECNRSLLWACANKGTLSPSPLVPFLKH